MDSAAAIGIDLGTTNSCVAVFLNGRIEIIVNKNGNRTTPSYVAFTDEERLYGEDAKIQAAMNPLNTIFDAKRLIGRRFSESVIQKEMKNYPFVLRNDDDKIKIEATYKGKNISHMPEEISAMVLIKLKESAEAYLGKTVTDAVITVPAYFNDAQRRATTLAGEIAGLNVLRIINEPTAAAIAYGMEYRGSGKRHIMVFDLGGGTFDVSILQINNSILEVKATNGDTHLGGEDFDNRLVSYFVNYFKQKYDKDLQDNKRAISRLRMACEIAKRTLSTTSSTKIQIDSLFENIDLVQTASRALFDELNDDLFQSTMKIVEETVESAKLLKEDIDDVVLVGGSTRIPKIQNLLQSFFGKELSRTINPDEAVAYGAAIQAAILCGEKAKIVRDLFLLDVTPLSLGIEVLGGKMSTVIKRNSLIPTKHTKEYVTCEDNQTTIQFNVFEGEQRFVKDNNLIGEFELSNITPASKGKAAVHVTFDINANSILNVTASEKTEDNTKDNTKKIILKKNERGLVTKEGIEQMLKDVEEYRLEDENKEEIKFAKNSLESYVYNLKTSLKEEKFKEKISVNDLKDILDKCDNTISYLNENLVNSKEELESRHNELHIAYEAIIQKFEEATQ